MIEIGKNQPQSEKHQLFYYYYLSNYFSSLYIVIPVVYINITNKHDVPHSDIPKNK